MRKLILFVALCLIGSIGQAEVISPNEYISFEKGRINNFTYIVSENCKWIFYQPRIFRFSSDKSAKFPLNGSTHYLAILRPEFKEPTEQEKQQIISKELDRQNRCHFTEIGFKPYPSRFVTIKIAGVSGQPTTDGNWLFEIKKSDVSQAIPLKNVGRAPTIKMNFFRREILASVSLFAEYSASADFLQKHWPDRNCRTSQKKLLFLSMDEEHCDEIYRVKQFLDDFEYRSKIILTTSAKSFASSRVAALEKRILSRWAMSSFIWIHEYRVQETLHVTFGEFKKNAYDFYKDEIHDEEIVKESFEATAQVYGLETIGVKP